MPPAQSHVNTNSCVKAFINASDEPRSQLKSVKKPSAHSTKDGAKAASKKTTPAIEIHSEKKWTLLCYPSKRPALPLSIPHTGAHYICFLWSFSLNFSPIYFGPTPPPLFDNHFSKYPRISPHCPLDLVILLKLPSCRDVCGCQILCRRKCVIFFDLASISVYIIASILLLLPNYMIYKLFLSVCGSCEFILSQINWYWNSHL